MPFTLFWDMHSGGGTKEKYDKIYIEASEDEAKVIFYNRFGHNPERVSCTCCGEDYSVSQSETLEQASAFHRNCRWDDKSKGYIEEADNRYSNRKLISVDEYEKLDNVLVIRKDEIKDHERIGEVPSQGYIWV